ncbi:hypothetical protein F5984_06625 [Rudanella paleaurantiibacter]|uniref:Uncharacterized protein n=1 Tax=Rudanella paleaurantiibacter TaxID=2614655 RepID=A0A7J5U334_9BACT|nr:hypothetical protein [Rudanella paleaurantiibacter]KAB7731892.1 hypothetical protein F5984_06625 [Rudanella paleaurantiibacter]
MKSIVMGLVRSLVPLWRILGADPVALQAIVEVKLTMDNRRSYTALGRYGQGQTGDKNHQFLAILGVYALFGLFVGGVVLLVPPKTAMFIPLAVSFGYIMLFCAMTLLSDFSSLILDSADNQIILPRPVSGRTLLMARIVHIAGYLFAITLALSLVSLVVVMYRFGPVAGLVFLAMALLASMLMVFLTNVFYLLLMQFTSEERLREVINYFQIGMAVLFYGSYQVLPRLIDPEMFRQAAEWQTWFYAVPPMWMAGAVDMVIQPAFDTNHALLAVLAVVMPFGGLWFMSRVLGPVFNVRLAGLEQDQQPTTATGAARPPGALMQRLSRALTRTPLERAAFGLIWAITARDRKFKLKTYPQLGFGLAYIIVMSTGTLSYSGRSNIFYLFGLYYTGLFLMTAQYQLAASDDYKAAWVYGSTPISRPGEILSGALKALITKLMVPFYGLVAVYILWRYGFHTLDDILLAFSNSLIIIMSAAMLNERRLPFSSTQDVIRQNNTARNLVILLVMGLVGGAHYGLSQLPYAVGVSIPVSVGIFWYLFRMYRQTDWSQISFE